MSKTEELLKDLQHNTITFTMPLLSDSNKSILFRPIKTRDQKILAIERDEVKDIDQAELANFKAIVKLMDALVIKSSVSFADMELPDFIWLLINIRGKSIGEVIDLIGKCHSCNSNIEFSIDMFKDYEKKEKKKDLSNIVKITDKIVLFLGMLTLEDLYQIMGRKNFERDIASTAQLIKKVEYDGEVLDIDFETKYKIIEELSKENLDKLTKYADDISYGIKLVKPYKCPKCSHEGKYIFDAWQIISFF